MNCRHSTLRDGPRPIIDAGHIGVTMMGRVERIAVSDLRDYLARLKAA